MGREGYPWAQGGSQGEASHVHTHAAVLMHRPRAPAPPLTPPHLARKA